MLTLRTANDVKAHLVSEDLVELVLDYLQKNPWEYESNRLVTGGDCDSTNSWGEFERRARHCQPLSFFCFHSIYSHPSANQLEDEHDSYLHVNFCDFSFLVRFADSDIPRMQSYLESKLPLFQPALDLDVSSRKRRAHE